MAIQTKTLGVLVEPEGMATAQETYDDVRLRLETARIINTHPTLTARLSGFVVANPAKSFTLDCPPNQTVTQNIPTGQQARFDITIDAQGRIDGVEYRFSWVAP